MEDALPQVAEDFEAGLEAMYEVVPLLDLSEVEVKPELPSLQVLGQRLSQTPNDTRLIDATGLNQEQLTVLFLAASHLFDTEVYKKAEKALFALICLCPDSGFFWGALGQVLEAQEKVDAALEAYWMASLVAPTDPAPYAHCAALADRCGEIAMLKELAEQAREAVAMIEDLETQQQMAECAAALKELAKQGG